MLVKGLLAVLPVVCEAYHYGFAWGGGKTAGSVCILRV